ncbi:hypothetical protein BY996DRAFT_6408861 [Phakopsora pachyrhizi]|nr:hypothetical protein BY996DRAFT_6408861 [Phakopsora pachyrhizi]
MRLSKLLSVILVNFLGLTLSKSVAEESITGTGKALETVKNAGGLEYQTTLKSYYPAEDIESGRPRTELAQSLKLEDPPNWKNIAFTPIYCFANLAGSKKTPLGSDCNELYSYLISKKDAGFSVTIVVKSCAMYFYIPQKTNNTMRIKLGYDLMARNLHSMNRTCGPFDQHYYASARYVRRYKDKKFTQKMMMEGLSVS